MVTKGVSSGVAPIFVDNSGQNRILVVKGANDRLSPADVDDAGDLLRTADCIVLQLEVPPGKRSTAPFASGAVTATSAPF